MAPKSDLNTIADLRVDNARLRAEVAALREALIWCSGSADFAPGGQAREGWLKTAAPLLTSALPAPSPREQAEQEAGRLCGEFVQIVISDIDKKRIDCNGIRTHEAWNAAEQAVRRLDG